jgi:hypothetical protein
LITGRNFFPSEEVVFVHVTSSTGGRLGSCSKVTPIDSFSLYCTIESKDEFKGFFRVTVLDQTSDAIPESSIMTTQRHHGIEIDPTLPFFRESVVTSGVVSSVHRHYLKSECNSNCHAACLSAHPQYLVKKVQVSSHCFLNIERILYVVSS